MVFAVAVPLQASIDRIRWLPEIGLGIVFLGHVIVNSLWGSPGWHELIDGLFSRFA